MKLLSSLTNRVFLATALLAVLAIGFTVAFVSAQVTAEAEAELRRGLVEAGAVVDRHRYDVFETFTLLARLIADLPKLKAAVTTGDPPTVRPLVDEYRHMLTQSDLVAVTDRGGRVLAGSGGGGLPQEALPGLSSVRSALGGAEATAFRAHPSGVLQVVTVPITAGQNPPEIIGTLSVGFLLDQRLAEQFKGLTGSEIAFAFGGHVLAATLPGEPARAGLESLLGSAGISHVSVGGDDYVAMLRPLPPLGPAVAAHELTPVAVVLRSRTERLRFLGTIHTVMAGTVIVTVLLATGLSYAVARTVTRPLAAIMAGMRDMARTGDLTQKITTRPARWEDEDARLLAATFNTLTESIARFQREVAQRERLSSLGRLSTVIAHEIRNPLMIIKASLRALARAGSPPEVIQEAAADIDGEVVRLDRIVAEVLDFAKPIRFDLAGTDVNGVCIAAVAAASAGAPEPVIRLSLDPAVPEITSDGERLRTVLINLLANARHAVRSRPAGPDGGGGAPPDAAAPIAVRTRLAGDRVAVTVSDTGVGIDPGALPHVFEPYFTTTRTGTGLGLAIAKHIVEGLGGTIAVRSRPGAGTDVLIELPLAAGTDVRRPGRVPPVAPS